MRWHDGGSVEQTLGAESMKMKAVEGLALFATAVMVFIVLAAIVSDDSRTDGQSVPPLLLQGGGSPQG
ncbi:MAG TPA: hypothetical protein HPQ00_16600, partial [Magnetococcales bacterium]|nr:hypothetical protein [Magnetococcales bacterium]